VKRAWLVGLVAVAGVGLVVAAIQFTRTPEPSRKTAHRPAKPRRVVEEIVPPAPIQSVPEIANPVPKEKSPEPVPAKEREEVVPEEETISGEAGAELKDELRELLEVSDETAGKVVQLLTKRDEEAERILTPCGDELSREEILETQPRLRHLDGQTDLAVLALLTPAQQDTYNRLRAEGFIAGTMLDLPPDLPVEEMPVEENDGE